VRNQNSGESILALQGLQQREDALGGRAVEVSGGFICQQNARLRDQCSSYRYALLLAAGEFP
jgi:hypothetical protein